jgi:hypothetical protein
VPAALKEEVDRLVVLKAEEERLAALTAEEVLGQSNRELPSILDVRPLGLELGLGLRLGLELPSILFVRPLRLGLGLELLSIPFVRQNSTLYNDISYRRSLPLTQSPPDAVSP